MACPETRIQPEPPHGRMEITDCTFTTMVPSVFKTEPPPPARDPYAGPGASFFVVGCLNCRYCGDAGHPHKPERWMCSRTAMECHEARNMPNACGIGGRLFRDALIGS